MTIEPFSSNRRAERKTDSFTLVLFGATGDLVKRKLLPAFYSLVCQGLLTGPYAVVGFARREGDDDSFRKAAREAIQQFAPRLPTTGPTWEEFESNLHYHSSNLDDPIGYTALKDRLACLDKEKGLGGSHLFYLATPPSQFGEVAQQLGKAGLVKAETGEPGKPWTRIIVEKPFGTDLRSCRALNTCIQSSFAEKQIFRIDHYLGKETVQNILVMRFANKLYELLWNQSVIDNVQITVAETLGLEGRGGYFDRAGITRDIVQNHVLQILTLIAMEPPVDLSADAIRDEKVKVLHSIRPFSLQDVRTHTVRGQYADGRFMDSAGKPIDSVGYSREEGVTPGSSTETYSAIRFHIDNWRWAGVPFYVRAGKRMPTRATEITIQLKAIPDVLFARMDCAEVAPNLLTLRIQPNERIVLRMAAKEPGPSMQVEPVEMQFDYAQEFNKAIPEAYERLILDAILGEAALFARADEVETAWSLVTPILEAWETLPQLPEPYFAGTWGPRSADILLEAKGHAWHNPTALHRPVSL